MKEKEIGMREDTTVSKYCTGRRAIATPGSMPVQCTFSLAILPVQNMETWRYSAKNQTLVMTTIQLS